MTQNLQASFCFQVHHWELNDEPDGFVLILKKSFVDISLDKELKNLLTQVSAFSCIFLQDEKIVGQLFNILELEYQSELNSHMPVTEGLLKALLGKILQLEKPVHQQKERHSIFSWNTRKYLAMIRRSKTTLQTMPGC